MTILFSSPQFQRFALDVWSRISLLVSPSHYLSVRENPGVASNLTSNILLSLSTSSLASSLSSISDLLRFLLQPLYLNPGLFIFHPVGRVLPDPGCRVNLNRLTYLIAVPHSVEVGYLLRGL